MYSDPTNTCRPERGRAPSRGIPARSDTPTSGVSTAPGRARRALLFLLLLAPILAASQEPRYAVPAASVEDEFSSYRQALDHAADRVLADAERFAGAATPDLSSPAAVPVDDRAVQRFARDYWNGEQQSVRSAVDRVADLRPTLEPILAEENIPTAAAALILVESGGRPAALSPKGALGVWQFMPDTARRYGLTVSNTRDDRLDVVKSTRAAARYLRQLHARFGDWPLVFAAYNAGEAAVEQAIARAGGKDFSRLADFLPRETRSYVPAVLRAITLFGNAQLTPAASATVAYAAGH